MTGVRTAVGMEPPAAIAPKLRPVALAVEVACRSDESAMLPLTVTPADPIEASRVGLPAAFVATVLFAIVALPETTPPDVALASVVALSTPLLDTVTFAPPRTAPSRCARVVLFVDA